MQEALKNPHYKKIWERVNWQERHPEAESLEEALEMEAMKDYCLFYNESKKEYGMNKSNVLTRCNIEEKQDLSASFLYEDDRQVEDWQQGSNFQILGRPITLFDVLKLLQKNIENGEFALMTNCVVLCNIDVTRNTSNDTFQYFVKKICDINNKSNLIEEQTPETWEKIANLID